MAEERYWHPSPDLVRTFDALMRAMQCNWVDSRGRSATQADVMPVLGISKAEWSHFEGGKPKILSWKAGKPKNRTSSDKIAENLTARLRNSRFSGECPPKAFQDWWCSGNAYELRKGLHDIVCREWYEQSGRQIPIPEFPARGVEARASALPNAPMPPAPLSHSSSHFALQPMRIGTRQEQLAELHIELHDGGNRGSPEEPALWVTLEFPEPGWSPDPGDEAEPATLHLANFQLRLIEGGDEMVQQQSDRSLTLRFGSYEKEPLPVTMRRYGIKTPRWESQPVRGRAVTGRCEEERLCTFSPPPPRVCVALVAKPCDFKLTAPSSVDLSQARQKVLARAIQDRLLDEPSPDGLFILDAKERKHDRD